MKWRKALWLVVGFLALVTVAPAVFLGEFALKPFPRPQPVDPNRVSIQASDGERLVATFRKAQSELHRCVVLLHGHASYRGGMPGLTRDYLAAGYHVLSPDNRGHGESGGRQTYGLLERFDVQRWTDWLGGQDCAGGVYAHGLSMGAAIALEAAAVEPRLRAVVADSPFMSFAEIGYDRVAQMAPLLSWWNRPIARAGFLYVWARYGYDLEQASPLRFAPEVKQPVLLIHGELDKNVAPRHSEALVKRYAHAERWLVAGCGHVGCYALNPAAYMEKTLGWYQ